LLVLLRNDFFQLLVVMWPQFTGEVGKFKTFWCTIVCRCCTSKLL